MLYYSRCLRKDELTCIIGTAGDTGNPARRPPPVAGALVGELGEETRMDEGDLKGGWRVGPTAGAVLMVVVVSSSACVAWT